MQRLDVCHLPRVMFNSPLSWLPTSLLCLLFASPVLSSRPPLTTPYDPFHAIAALAPKPHQEPICCLKPLTPLEPVDDDLFLSFEDWKAKRSSESNNSQKGSVPPNDSAPTRVPDESPAEQLASAVILDASDSALTTPGPDTATPAPPPHFRVPLTDRFNYASLDCSARVHTAHRGAKSASSILSSKRDRYMLSPCAAAQPQFVVVELCEDIRIDTVQLANFEFFSGVFKEFTVSVAKTYVTDAEGWTVVGTYVGKNVRGVQVRTSMVMCERCSLMDVDGWIAVVSPPYVYSRLLSIHTYRLSLSLLQRVLLPHLPPPRLWPHASRAMEVGHVGGRKQKQGHAGSEGYEHVGPCRRHLGDREAR